VVSKTHTQVLHVKLAHAEQNKSYFTTPLEVTEQSQS
jgi:hypothetical protein